MTLEGGSHAEGRADPAGAGSAHFSPVGAAPQDGADRSEGASAAASNCGANGVSSDPGVANGDGQQPVASHDARLLQSLPLFSRLPPHHIAQLASMATVRRLPCGHEIVKQGEVGHTLYVITEGQSKVLVQSGRTSPTLFSKQPTHVATLAAGDHFGESALTGDGVVHASVVTSTPTSLLCLTRETYQTTSRALREADALAAAEFLRTASLFDEWTEESLTSLAGVMTMRRYPPGHTVVRQGGSSQSIFFIRRGTCGVVLWVPKSGRQESQKSVAATIAQSVSSAAAAAASNHSFMLSGTGSPESDSFSRSRAGTPTVLTPASSFVVANVAAEGLVGRVAVDGKYSTGAPGSRSANGVGNGAGEVEPSEADPLGMPASPVLRRDASSPEPSEPAGIEAVDVCELHAGQYFGELSLLLDTGHTASVVTRTPVELYVISRSDWKRRLPGRVRGQMCSAMLSHAEVAYTGPMPRSVSIGLLDDFVPEPSNVSEELERKLTDSFISPHRSSPVSLRETETGVGDKEGNSSFKSASSAMTRREEEGSMAHMLWTQVLPLFSPSLVQATAMGLLIPVLPLYAMDLTPHDSVVGAVVSGRGTGLIVGGPIAGIAIAAFGLLPGLVIGLLLSALSAIAGALCFSVWPLLATRVLAGIGLSFFQVGRQMYVSMCVVSTSRGTISSLIAGTTRLGTTIGPMVGGQVVQISGSSRNAFWIEGLLFACAALLVKLFMRLHREAEEESFKNNRKAKSGPSCLGFGSRALLCTPVLIALGFARAARELLLPVKASALGSNAAEVGAMTAASFAVDTALVPIAGYVMDRYGRRYAGVPALVLSALGLVALAFASTSEACLMAAIALGLGNGMSNGWIQTVGADLAPSGSRPQFLGMWNLLMGVGTAIGPLTCGAIAQWRDVDEAALAAAFASAAGAAWYATLGVETLLPEQTGLATTAMV